MRKNRDGSRVYNKIQRKGWTSGADVDCRLQASCSLSWNIGTKTVLGSLQTSYGLSWSVGVQAGAAENVQRDDGTQAENAQPVETAIPEAATAQAAVYTHVDVRL